jgi:N-ethylmaleimide reductase
LCRFNQTSSLDQVEGWQLVTEAVHENDGRIFLQLWHVRRFPHPALHPDGMLPVAAAASKPASEAFIADDGATLTTNDQ